MSELMPESYYDAEAEHYDESRGGQARAEAAATAIGALVPLRGTCLDVAGGTGIVSAALARRGLSVVVLDGSTGMLAEAARRLPGRVLRGGAERLPVADASVDLVTIVWMLNLIPSALVDAVLTEASRVLRPGGHLVVTVDKELAHSAVAHTDSDAEARITPVLAGLGLDAAGSTTFSGRSVWGSVTDQDPVFRLAAYRRGPVED